MSAPTATELTQKFETFLQRGRDLAGEVRSLLPGLVESGRPLPAATLQGMAVYKQKYIALCEFAWPNRSAPVGAPTFEHFRQRIAELTPAPLTPIDRVLSLTAIPGSEGLLESIRTRIGQSPEDDKERVNGVAGDLLSLISGDENVTDERWQELIDSVTAVFGREVALAAARGKLKLPAP